MSGVTFTGYQNFQRRLSQIQNPPTAAKDDMGKEAVKGFESNYQGNPLGWAPLKPETVKRKGSARILYQTGAMMKSYKFRLMPWGIQAYSDDPKATIHQKTRPHLVLRSDVLQLMLKALVAGMLK